MSTSITIAKKHLEFGARIKQIAESKGYSGQVYIATHILRRSAPNYHQAEQDSGEDFWSIKAWTPSPPRDRNLKDPDLIITHGVLVKFFVEVKWGMVSGADTDLKLGSKEGEKIKRLLGAQSAYCIVNGPVGKDHIPRQKFFINEHTQFLLVTDIPAHLPLQSCLDSWAGAGFRVADIERQVGRFSSLREVLEDGN